LLAAAEVGGVALLFDAKNEQSAKWYESFGAVRVADTPFTLLLPLTTLEKALGSLERR
jgi:hypothetical protein